MNLELPSGSDQLLGWAWLVLGWVIAQYTPIPESFRRAPEPAVRAGATAVVTLLLITGDTSAVVLIVAVATGLSALLVWKRDWAIERNWEALWELGVPVVFLFATAALIAPTNVEPWSWLPTLDGRSDSMLYPVLLAAAVVYSWEGGSSVVSGVLARMAIPTDDETLIESKAASRGELIGRLERLVLIVLVTQGAFTALAFLIAAKGFVRSKEFDDDRDFAEYFLIGTLVSITLGLMLGIGVAAIT